MQDRKEYEERQEQVKGAILSVQSLRQYLALERLHADQIKVKRMYVDMAGDLAAGVLLGQILYWFTPKKNGDMKVSIEHEGKLWLAKSRKDWWNEIRLTPKQFDRACWLLEKRNLIETIICKFSGSPTKHFRPNEDEIMKQVKAIFTNRQFGYSPKGNFVFSQRVKRKYTKGEKPSIIAKTTS